MTDYVKKIDEKILSWIKTQKNSKKLFSVFNLLNNSSKPMNVTYISSILNINKVTASKYLKILENGGCINIYKVNKVIFYYVDNYETVSYKSKKTAIYKNYIKKSYFPYGTSDILDIIFKCDNLSYMRIIRVINEICILANRKNNTVNINKVCKNILEPKTITHTQFKSYLRLLTTNNFLSYISDNIYSINKPKNLFYHENFIKNISGSNIKSNLVMSIMYLIYKASINNRYIHNRDIRSNIYSTILCSLSPGYFHTVYSRRHDLINFTSLDDVITINKNLLPSGMVPTYNDINDDQSDLLKRDNQPIQDERETILPLETTQHEQILDQIKPKEKLGLFRSILNWFKRFFTFG